MRRTTPSSTAIRDTEKLSYSVPEAAEMVGISERRMWDRVREGLIQSYRDGHRRLISRRALEEYVSSKDAA